MFPGHFKGVVFCSVAIIDSGNFKGIGEVHELERRVEQALDRYVQYAGWLGLPAERTFSTGIEVAVEAERIADEVVKKFPRAPFFPGHPIFHHNTFLTPAPHTPTAFTLP